MLTNEQVQEYLSKSGSSCPYCGSLDMDGEKLDADGDSIVQLVTCKKCGKTWNDVYHLVGVEEVAVT